MKYLEVNPKATKTILLLHGYGASETDFAPILPWMKKSENYRWIFLRAPLEVDVGLGQKGYAWFPLDWEIFLEAQKEGSHPEFRLEAAQGFEKARGQVLQFLLDQKISFSDLIIGGFSQGTTIAVDIALKHPQSPAGFFALSAVYLKNAGWIESAQTRGPLQFFQSHGRADPLLSFSEAKTLYEELTQAGLVGEFVEFSGGHEVPPNVLRAWDEFLLNVFESNGVQKS